MPQIWSFRQMQYLVEPLPSSRRCTRWCSANRASVLKRGGFVHAVQRLFQIGHAERVVETVHRFVYEYPDRCGADTVAVQYLVGSCLSVVHGMVCFRQIWRKNPSYSSSRPVFRVRLQFSPGRRAQDIVKYGFLQPFVLSCFRPIPLSVGPDGVWRGVRGLSRCSL